MYGQSATKLIRHITTHDTDILPPYQHDLIHEIMQENSQLFEENCRATQPLDDQQQVNGIKQQQDPEPDDQDQNTDHQQAQHPAQRDDPIQQQDDSMPPVEKKEVPANVDDETVDEKKLILLQVRHTAKLWNRRCLLAYHYERLNRLRKLRWEYGNNLPSEIKKNLSEEEQEWFTRYNDNLFNYMRGLNDGKGLDITLYVSPPKRLWVCVKCLTDYGELDLEAGRGNVKLIKDNIYYLPLNLAEKLIHQGVLTQLTN